MFFTVFGYQMSYLEFFGTIFNLICVWLVTRNNIWNWLIGNIGVVFFMVLFYQIQLYSDFFEQIYYLITGFYGWWAWWYYRKNKTSKNSEDMPITNNSLRSNVIYLAIIVIGTWAMGYFMGHINVYFPAYFPEAASFPYLDAFTTVMSFVATILLAHKKVQAWYLWIVVDVIGIGLYYQKGVVFIALLYVIFLILATKGLFNWRKLIDKSYEHGTGDREILPAAQRS